MISNKWKELYKIGDRVQVYAYPNLGGNNIGDYCWMNGEVIDYHYNCSVMIFDYPDQELPIIGLEVKLDEDPKSFIRSVLSFNKVKKV